MKKNIFILAAVALMMGVTACSKDDNEPVNNEPVNNVDLSSALVKSAADLIGTEWSYAMEDIVLVDDEGDTIGIVPMNDLVFGLTFDNDYAHFTFPEDITALRIGEDENGMPTLEEFQELSYVYTYDPSTQTGALTAEFTDEEGNPETVQIPFTYDIATDGIFIDFELGFEDGSSLPLVFHRI
ncbi:MAG: hypothetical protein AUK63_664 [bacterium P3]|nr:MAG: hypothetical protein AUK63_664 [bacterium P3]KWW42147.1 MAG: hypothetical protein F083_486 [bacterium F083]